MGKRDSCVLIFIVVSLLCDKSIPAMNFKPKMTKTSDEQKYDTVDKHMVSVNNLITFSPEQNIVDVIDIILDKKISGAPVLDQQRRLVGMLSEKDCLRLIIDRAYHNLPNQKSTVETYMTTAVRSVPPDMDVVKAANEFLIAPVRRFPVVDDGILLGQISRRDILRAAREISSTNW